MERLLILILRMQAIMFSLMAKKLLYLSVLICCSLTQTACGTTQDQRITYGTFIGAGVGAAVGALSDNSELVGSGVGAALGATLGFLSY